MPHHERPTETISYPVLYQNDILSGVVLSSPEDEVSFLSLHQTGHRVILEYLIPTEDPIDFRVSGMDPEFYTLHELIIERVAELVVKTAEEIVSTA